MPLCAQNEFWIRSFRSQNLSKNNIFFFWKVKWGAFVWRWSVFAKNGQKTYFFYKNHLPSQWHFESTIILSYIILNTAVKILSHCGGLKLNSEPFHIYLKFIQVRLLTKISYFKLFFIMKCKIIEFHIFYSSNILISFDSLISFIYYWRKKLWGFTDDGFYWLTTLNKKRLFAFYHSNDHNFLSIYTYCLSIYEL